MRIAPRSSMVLLCNSGKELVEIKIGDRVAQLIVEKIYNPPVEVVQRLEEMSRGIGGFGSTGVNVVEEAKANRVIIE